MRSRSVSISPSPICPPGAKAFMKELSDLMAQKAGLQRQITEWTQQVQRLTEEQGRLRSNVQSLGTSTEGTGATGKVGCGIGR